MIDGKFGNVSTGVCFRKLRINENGGKQIMSREEHSDIMFAAWHDSNITARI